MTDLAEAIQPAAAALACAVDAHDAEAVAEVLEPLDRQQLYALAVVLAAHIDIEQPMHLRAGLCDRAIRMAADAFQVAPGDVLSADRTRDVTSARMVAMTVAHRAGMTTVAIGKHFGRDHSTVINAVTKVAREPRLSTVAAHLCYRLGVDSEGAA